MKATCQKPAGGFLAIGPRFFGEPLEEGTAVRVAHPGLRTWTETVPLEHLEKVTEPVKPRRRWK